MQEKIGFSFHWRKIHKSTISREWFPPVANCRVKILCCAWGLIKHNYLLSPLCECSCRLINSVSRRVCLYYILIRFVVIIYRSFVIYSHSSRHLDNCGVLCQKWVSRARTTNYIPQCPWDVITCPCLWYPILEKFLTCILAIVPIVKDMSEIHRY